MQMVHILTSVNAMNLSESNVRLVAGSLRNRKSQLMCVECTAVSISSSPLHAKWTTQGRSEAAAFESHLGMVDTVALRLDKADSNEILRQESQKEH
jgi:hypothetical protein